MTVLRIVSYNIHKGKTALGRRSSLLELSAGLSGLKADLVFLQEIQGRNEREHHLHAQPALLAGHLHMEVAYGCNAIRKKTDHGNALLSKYEIIDHENEDISDHKLEQRGVLHARVKVGGHRVHCFVVHLGLFHGSRIRQVAAIIERIKRMVPEDEPLIIAGDFNDWNEKLAPFFVKELGVHEVFAQTPLRLDDELPRMKVSFKRLWDTFSFRKLMETEKKLRYQRIKIPEISLKTLPKVLKHLQDSDELPPARTFPAAFPWLRLDRMYQRGFEIRSAQVLKGRPWSKISDHAPICVELALVKPQADAKADTSTTVYA